MARYAPDYALPPVDETAVKFILRVFLMKEISDPSLRCSLCGGVPGTSTSSKYSTDTTYGHVLVVGNYFIVAEEAMAITWYFFQNVVVTSK